MPIQVRLYGDLRKILPQHNYSKGAPSVIDIDGTEIKLVSDIFKKIGIEESETSHIFVNRIFSGLLKKVKDGDRVAIFPKNMGLLYKWYFKKVEDNDE